MAKINVLPRSISELIAAGEVCERPSSVVKELIENSIDALADKITVEISSGGVRYIRISDNGQGIERADVRTAFLSHATSKIASSADLESIYTLGFRGEALASVCAVSKTEMLTKTAHEEFGTRYVTQGGEEILLDDAGCPQGTTIIVRDLFYNTPARMKFLKKDVTEGNYVSDAVAKAALSHPEVSFRLIKDDREVLFTPGGGNLTDAVRAVYGKEFVSGLIECGYSLGGVDVKGLVSKPLHSRPNRNMQHFFVNKRYARLPFASAALDQAYKNSVMTGKFPSALIFIDVDAALVDVNVHPAKTEVRFSDEKRVFEAVYYAARNAISSGDTRPEVKFPQKNEIRAYEDFLQKGKKTEQTFMRLPSDGLHDGGRPVESQWDGGPRERPALNDAGNAYSAEPKGAPDLCSIKNAAVFPPAQGADKDAAAPGAINAGMPPEDEKGGAAPQRAEEAPVFKLIGEAYKTYIIVERGEKLLIVDKHAAHERMLFDAMSSGKTEKSSQILMSPVSVTLSKKEYAAVIENLPLLNGAGFAVEDFGDGSVIVRECPVGLDYDDIPGLIEEFAGHLCLETRELVSEKLEWLRHSAACRAAVKAGDGMSALEMRDFIGRLLEDGVRYCPHGRPVIIEMTRNELEKQFGRTK